MCQGALHDRHCWEPTQVTEDWKFSSDKVLARQRRPNA